MNIFLGEPSPNVKQWIIDHYVPASNPKTVFHFASGPDEEYLISGDIDEMWLENNGFKSLNEETWEVTWYKSPSSIEFGTNVTYIGEGAFDACSQLTSISLPNTIRTIGFGAFAGTHLTSVVIPNGVLQIDGDCFNNCGMVSVTLGNSLIQIGDNAFGGNSFTSITIPASVTFIGEWVFDGCRNLTSVTFLGKTMEQVQAMDHYEDWGIDTAIINVA